MQDTKQVAQGLDPRLIQDIQDFIPIFNRPPTIAEVTDWANDFYSLHGPKKRWIQKLITTASSPLKGEGQGEGE